MAKFLFIENINKNMPIEKKFILIIFNNDKINDFNKVIIKYADSVNQSSSHLLFETEPISIVDIAQDVTFFNIIAEDEDSLNRKMDDLIEELKKFNSYYSIRNTETRELFTDIVSVGAIDIKFDNIKVIPKGTYKKIDEIKNLITEFGSCKGYKPTFRPLEGNSVENLKLQDEIIYLFSNSHEDMAKLQDYMSKKALEINPDFLIGTRTFV
ncbi:hypothetical protein [Methanobrevibacter sp.]|uniref:hypothetical protein n=1 Tax=Methanobrevibacter sp. TaxID=66852 RepID=UPI0026E0A16E|nr:hypothetical protein [Methanobrevibacter sp.]